MTAICIKVSAVLLVGVLSMSGCTSFKKVRLAEGEASIIQGPTARDNTTPLADAYACMADRLSGTRPVGISVGDVKDYTGKYSDSEGNAITQGGALMVISALGKLGPSIQLHERFDTRIAELELVYMEKRQLGDGKRHEVDGKVVPWQPYYGGTIRGSDYFIVGGLTELNYNIQSGGAEFYVSQIGAKARTYTMNVAADLRIVDSKSLVVKHTVSLQKQITGYEVGAGVFSFFGSALVDVNVGAKNQEPLQLGVRTVLELGVLELVSSVKQVAFEPCLTPFEQPVAEALSIPDGSMASRNVPSTNAAKVAKAPVAKPTTVAAAQNAKPAPVPSARPAIVAAVAPPPVPKPETDGGVVHVVVEGESMGDIGRKYGVDPVMILAANGITAVSSVRIGQTLRIPAAAKPGKATTDPRDPLNILDPQ